MRIGDWALIWGLLALVSGCGRITRHTSSEGSSDTNTETRTASLVGTLDTNVYYQIRPYHNGTSNQCLDVAFFSKENGGRIHQYECAGRQANQLWRLAAIGDGRFQIVSAQSGKCLDVTGTSSINRLPIANTANSALFQQWDCADSAFFSNQTFRLVPSGVQDYLKIQAVHSGRCLDIDGRNSQTWAPIPNSANWAAAHQWDCAPAQGNQLFRFEPVSLGKNVAYQRPVISNLVSPSPAYALPPSGRPSRDQPRARQPRPLHDFGDLYLHFRLAGEGPGLLGRLDHAGIGRPRPRYY